MTLGDTVTVGNQWNDGDGRGASTLTGKYQNAEPSAPELMPGCSRDPSNEDCVIPFSADRENGVQLRTDQREDDVEGLLALETSAEWLFPLELVDHVRHHAHAQGFVVPVEP